ncbi:MAG: phospholipid carrier-dependent glycosyltransferase, partial [Chloroflexi bacterium]|nr:phospholipid carrier-dependent glycosyltransferase [Chloroflexota bacterium]
MKSSKSIVIIIPCIIVFVIAIAINLWVTENGVGIHPDSTTYIGTAINILKGNGFYLRGEPMTHYPPLYPIILAISGSFNSNVADSARWLHALLYGVNVVLFGVSIYISTHRNLVAMILGFLIFLSSKAVLTIHSYAFSESPFLMFSLLAYLLFSLYISSNRWVYLILSSVSIGLALATRYVGLALFPPVIIVLFLFVKQP